VLFLRNFTPCCHFRSLMFMSCNFLSSNFVLQFHVLQIGPSFSRPAFSVNPCDSVVFCALHEQLASLDRHAQLTRCFWAAAELLVFSGSGAISFSLISLRLLKVCVYTLECANVHKLNMVSVWLLLFCSRPTDLHNCKTLSCSCQLVFCSWIAACYVCLNAFCVTNQIYYTVLYRCW